ncbi:uncharacterized protein LOC133191313 [Saccostrea echinata]|uniref:uncharacterized protein LOC133191313 n=1 Tax=Saccostrea echinata TaxID=191078 RepID=UPI002A80FC99|nr:uncharacterized protein LOC133191313 [Saccostrea echinata]
MTTSTLGESFILKKRNLCDRLIAAAVVTIIPCIHIGIVNNIIWVPEKPKVNRTRCHCDCFDTVFKGSYERVGKTTYKHIYFNATYEMLVIWVMTLGVIIVSYESFKHLYDLYNHRLLRWRMFFLFILDVYPNYYSYWMFFNYTNDGYYSQFYHQMFFTVTELFSTWTVFQLCSKTLDTDSIRSFIIISISLIHILLGGVDQFFAQLILWQDNAFQRFRDLGFLLPDLLHVLFTIQLLSEERRTKWEKTFTINELRKISVFVFSGFLVGKFLFS